MVTPLTDGQAWLDLLHGAFRFIPSTIAFAFTVVWWAAALGGLSWSLWGWSTLGAGNEGLPELLGFDPNYTTDVVFYLVIGAFFAVTLYPVVRGVALLEALFARGLLSGVNELRTQVAEANAAREVAQAQKAAAVSAEATALRKLERDIHDGPQQRLVRLAMDLGRAEQQFATDPEKARATVAEALTQTRETLDELRALSRGIAPPILVDRGLGAALTALAGRCTVPVELDAPVMERLDPVIESTAYFVVAESLTNIAKHSRAGEVHVSVQRLATGLLVSVSDDGIGGASLAKGHGLAGLDDRVRAAGGVLSLDSPDGEGTRITAALPL
jgi:signal transduction histidine kinase